MSSFVSDNERHVAVIGASGGIGLETARLLASRGARVTLGARRGDRLEAAVKEVGGQASAVVVDAVRPDSLRQFFAECGPITDLVVTVTRRGGAGAIADLVEADLPGAFIGKTIAQLQAVALALPTLADDGSITLVSAISAQSATPGTVGLAAVNGAVEAAVAPLALELAPRRVNAVSPGVIVTEWWDEFPQDAREDAFREYAQRVPVRRNGRPEEVAHAIAALIENAFITGVVLPCDGGLRLT
jgi:NAD(P)-dependent dehydrogenase (short-subunit alcohol dehydrogenase family)